MGGAVGEYLSKHDENRAEKRERLLHAGLEAFAETGYENTTVSDIVRRAGMTPSTFYNYFEDKDALLDQLLGELAEEVLEGLAAVRAAAPSPEDYVRAAVRGFLESVVLDPAAAMLFRRNLGLVRRLVDGPALAGVADALVTDMARFAAEQSGDVVDPRLAAVLLRACTLEVTLEMLDGAEESELDHAASFVARLFGGGFAKVADDSSAPAWPGPDEETGS